MIQTWLWHHPQAIHFNSTEQYPLNIRVMSVPNFGAPFSVSSATYSLSDGTTTTTGNLTVEDQLLTGTLVGTKGRYILTIVYTVVQGTASIIRSQSFDVDVV